MIYSVHGYYQKRGGRKAPGKIEAIVFATSAEAAQRLVESLFMAILLNCRILALLVAWRRMFRKYIHSGRS